MKGSFIVASAIFAGLVIVVVGFNVLIGHTPISCVDIGLVLGSLMVLIYTKPTVDEYLSLESLEKEVKT